MDASVLIKEAKTAGKKLYDFHRSGLVFSDDAVVLTLKEYGKSYDTFDYLFRPEPRDVADTKVKITDAIDGIIYIGGGDGVRLVTLPGVKIKLINLPAKQKSTGTSWRVWDKNGYEYIIHDLSSDPKEALKQLQTPGNRRMSGTIVKIGPI